MKALALTFIVQKSDNHIKFSFFLKTMLSRDKIGSAGELDRFDVKRHKTKLLKCRLQHQSHICCFVCYSSVPWTFGRTTCWKPAATSCSPVSFAISGETSISKTTLKIEVRSIRAGI